MKTGCLKFFVFLLLVGLQATVQPKIRTPRHPLAMQCADCHRAGQNVSRDNSDVLVRSQQQLCAACHAQVLVITHPVDVKMRRSEAAALRPDREGRLNCSTCHDIHGDTPGLLRTQQRGLDFCQQCHKPEFFDRMPDRGRSLVISGHMSPAGIQGRAGIDRYSLQCLSCHMDDDNAYRTGAGHGGLGNTGNGEHLIGVRYADYGPGAGYRPVNLLNRRILLPDGRLSCVSCHAGYSANHGNLVVDNARSALCFSCHML